MADAMAEYLGAHIVILVVGPVGSAKGEVGLRTYVTYLFIGQNKTYTSQGFLRYCRRSDE
jgi:hypothetical protein